MGDMEQYEARMCARDVVIDRYNHWLEAFPEQYEPRLTLISWKRFDIVCWRCETTQTVVKVGANSYELDCGHIADKALVDENVALAAADDARIAQFYGDDDDRYWYHCPVHVVKVRIDAVHGDDWYGGPAPVTYQLACGCLIDEAPDRMECYQCPKIDGVAVPMPRVTGRGPIIEAHRDATCTYKLECGHIAF